MKTLDWILRSVLAINFALVALSFIPAYRVLDLPSRNGWRVDFLWICGSALFIIAASIPFMLVGGVTSVKEHRYHRTAVLSLVWLACFVLFLIYNLLNAF